MSANYSTKAMNTMLGVHVDIPDNSLETDPSGLSPHTPGAKLDANKPNCDLVFGGFSKALLEVAKVGTYGAKKYTPYGWKEVDNGAQRYRSAAYRHLLEPNFLDKDSNLPTLACAAWNCLAALELLLQNNTQQIDKLMKTLIYLAGPYSNNPDVMFEVHAQYAASLLKDDKLVFSPILHNHHLAKVYNLPTDYLFWMRFDVEMIIRSDEVWVIKEEGWRESKGVYGELRVARELNKPVKFICIKDGVISITS